MQFDGFTGFLRLRALPRGCPQIPARSGIYTVVLESPASGFLAHSVAGHFKGKDPTVAIDALEAKWLDEVATVYVGRANDLRRRLDLLARYGRGEPVAHQGGRYLWQLVAHDHLRVAWRFEDDPVCAERLFLDDFQEAVGLLPFANLIRGTRSMLPA